MYSAHLLKGADIVEKMSKNVTTSPFVPSLVDNLEPPGPVSPAHRPFGLYDVEGRSSNFIIKDQLKGYSKAQLSLTVQIFFFNYQRQFSVMKIEPKSEKKREKKRKIMRKFLTRQLTP